MDERIIKNGFWVSNKNSKEGVGVKIVPICGIRDEIKSISIQNINHNHNDAIQDEIEVFKIEFSKLIQFADLLKKEIGITK